MSDRIAKLTVSALQKISAALEVPSAPTKEGRVKALLAFLEHPKAMSDKDLAAAVRGRRCTQGRGGGAGAAASTTTITGGNDGAVV